MIATPSLRQMGRRRASGTFRLFGGFVPPRQFSSAISRQSRDLRENQTSSPVDRPAESAAPAPVIPSSAISVWSQAILAAVAVGFTLYAARQLLQPIAAAFVVGVTLSPAARRLEALRAPRPVAAFLLVSGVALTIALVIALVVPRVSEVTEGLPSLAATWRDRLHALDGFAPLSRGAGDAADRLGAMFPTPSISWVPSTIGVLWPPIEGSCSFSSYCSCSSPSGRTFGAGW